jgi:tRNA G18 (ribose-2'-O)-methylase SpoU
MLKIKTGIQKNCTFAQTSACFAVKKLSIPEMNRLTAEDYKKASKIPLILVLDNVRSLHNIGSVFRTSDAFLVEKIILCGICSCPPQPEIHKTALGAEFTVDWAYEEDCLQALKALRQQGYILLPPNKPQAVFLWRISAWIPGKNMPWCWVTR